MAKKKHGDDEVEEIIKRKPNGTEHRDKCTSGFKRRWCSQIHHILPLSSLQDAHIKVSKDHLDFIVRCIKITDWNINDHYNTVGLPTKSAFYSLNNDKYFTMPIPSRGDTWSIEDNWDGWPSHVIDHNPRYTENVYDKLFDLIWCRLIQKKIDCGIKQEEIRDQLFKAAARYRKFLKKRGGDKGGTRHCWVHRHDPDMENTWYIPFSMDPGRPRKRKPPPSFKKLPQNLKQLLTDFFQLL
jgi:hypothetical protein